MVSEGTKHRVDWSLIYYVILFIHFLTVSLTFFRFSICFLFFPQPGCDHIYIKKVGTDDDWGQRRYSGSSRNFPGVTTIPPLEISCDEFEFKFQSDGSCQEWGWKFTVEAIYLYGGKNNAIPACMNRNHLVDMPTTLNDQLVNSKAFQIKCNAISIKTTNKSKKNTAAPEIFDHVRAIKIFKEIAIRSCINAVTRVVTLAGSTRKQIAFSGETKEETKKETKEEDFGLNIIRCISVAFHRHLSVGRSFDALQVSIRPLQISLRNCLTSGSETIAAGKLRQTMQGKFIFLCLSVYTQVHTSPN